jgi:hypothetical protein
MSEIEVIENTDQKPLPPFIRAIPFLFGRRVSLARLLGGLDISWLVILLILAASFAGDWWQAKPPRYFTTWGFAPFFTEVCILGIFCYGVSRLKQCLLPLPILLSLVLEVYFLVGVPLQIVDANVSDGYAGKESRYLAGFAATWGVLVIFHLLHQVLNRRYLYAIPATLLFVAFLIVPGIYLSYSQSKFWYHDNSDENSGYKKIKDYEQVFFNQEVLLKKALDAIIPGEEGKIELYYLGFGSYASQGVFKKEVEFFERMMDKQTPAKKYGMTLINHLDTLQSTPLAISHNLDAALQGIGEKMNRDEDILFLYLTSHGSKSHELAVSFYPFSFVDITPQMLKASLDKSGIRWKVIVVSACYSGGFIEPLKDANTLIATAADADHTSFGCSNENDFTYFGEALLQDQLAKGVQMPDAFAKAIEEINAREQREGKTRSNPQLWMEQPMVEHLQAFEHQQSLLATQGN